MRWTIPKQLHVVLSIPWLDDTKHHIFGMHLVYQNQKTLHEPTKSRLFVAQEIWNSIQGHAALQRYEIEENSDRMIQKPAPFPSMKGTIPSKKSWTISKTTNPNRQINIG